MQPKHGTAPIVIDESPGRRAYCQCGLSATLPHCDGAHARQGTGLTPIVCMIDAPGRVAVCQCHQSGNKPWCDGTHSRLARANAT